MAAGISRRTLLLGSAGVVGTAALGALAYDRATGLPSGVPSGTAGLRTVEGSFTSRLRKGATTGWRIAVPTGTSTPPRVVIALHGRGEDHAYAFDHLYLDHFLAGVLRTSQARPFAVASVDGGDHDYWHPRRDGDAAGMVMSEFLGVLAGHGIDTGRVGLLGWSMGGYGALYIAGRLGTARCAVAVAESPAIWHEAGQSADGAFDDAADFNTHSVLGHLDALKGIPLRIDCGTSDGFAPVTRDLRAALSPVPAGGIEPGGHDAPYWRSQADAQLRFAAQHLYV